MGHAHQPYPQFSVDCFKDLIRIARGRTIQQELPLFAKCVYTLQGAALGATIGEPGGVETFASEATPCSNDDKREALSVLQGLEEDGIDNFGADAALNPIVAALIQQAITALLAWLTKK